MVLAADERYSEKVLTTIKSICYHNKAFDFYLFNRDFSPEWFQIINFYLNKIGCHIFDVKVTSEQIKKYRTYEHISSDATYFRYFIADFVQADKVLYLDCDLVVNGSLISLFNLDLESNYIAACRDDLAKNFHNKNDFNAGVMLINNILWRRDNISEKAIDLSNTYIAQVMDGDQSILNMLFESRWIELNPTINYLVGGEYSYIKHNIPHLIMRKAGELPLILHYNTEYKPWLPIYDLPFREYYWFYYKLTWQEIIQRHN
ncbi:glycosyltransferase family 8 protein [Ursidibacter arcticus]